MINMKKIFLIFNIILITSCSSDVTPTPTPVPKEEKVIFEQVIDKGNILSSKDFFDIGFNEYKEYNVSKLTEATEAWYGYWGPDEDNVKYYELRFYPDHSTAVSEGTPFAKDATGDDAKLKRQETMWRVGLPDRKQDASCQQRYNLQRSSLRGECGSRVSKYADYIIFNNVIMLCEGKDSNEAFKLCHSLVNSLKGK
jgi:hypothetical protein